VMNVLSVKKMKNYTQKNKLIGALTLFLQTLNIQ